MYSMQRFRDLVHTRRSWLLVKTATAAASPSSLGVFSQHYRQQFTSLSAAIEASRPGDTILLEPGVHRASNLAITHPLQLLGDGATPDSCILRCSTTSSSTSHLNSSSNPSSLAFPVLNFASTAGRVSNLTIEGGIGGCIAHYKGRLEIEECALRCDARGLQHLAAPLVSFACSITPNEMHSNTDNTNTDNSNAEELKKIEQEEKEEKVEAAAVENLNLESSRISSAPPLHHHSLGPGIVSVIGCSMQGGSTAVKVHGTGAVRSVRVIYESHKALFWFEVDSQNFQNIQTLKNSREEHNPLSTATTTLDPTSSTSKEKHRSTVAETPLSPSWVDNNKLAIGFDPKALQAQVAQVILAAAATAPQAVATPTI